MDFLTVTVLQSSNHEIRLALSYIMVIDLVGCGNSLAGTIDLLMPWDPGRIVPNLKFLLYRLGCWK
jgi:hypothetical protein